jgi:predicted phage-related endonuclease
MKIHNLMQGSPEWHQFRLNHFGASEAAAMLGISSKVKRSELLRMKHCGIAKEFSDWIQSNILDYGHEVEAMARPIIEATVIGDDLYPVTCSDGKLSASCDGLTMSEEDAFEHKQWNEKLVASVSAGELPEEFMPQCQQILMITGAKRVVFTVSDGTPGKMVYMDVLPDEAWFDRLRAGWAQFEKDLAVYVPTVIAEKPQAEPTMALPALFIQARGEVTTNNIEAFGAAKTAFLASIKTTPVTDQDFANAKEAGKTCREAVEKLEMVKQAMLSQTVTIGEAAAQIDLWKEEFRLAALDREKVVERETEVRRLAIFNKAKTEYAEHIAALELETIPIRITVLAPDFAVAMKGKKSIKGWQDAVDTAMANGKIAADLSAKDIRAKLAWYKETSAGFGLLFADLSQIIVKPMDDFQLIVTTRIDAHKKTKADELESLRVKIQKEVEDKATAKAAAEAKERADAEVAAQVIANQSIEVAIAPVTFAQAIDAVAPAQIRQSFYGTSAPRTVNASKSSALVNLGNINTELGFMVTADFLNRLGFSAVQQKNAKLYYETDLSSIYAAIIRHIQTVAAKTIKSAA